MQNRRFDQGLLYSAKNGGVEWKLTCCIPNYYDFWFVENSPFSQKISAKFFWFDAQRKIETQKPKSSLGSLTNVDVNES